MMKMKRLVRTLGSAVLAASLCLTGCSADKPRETTEEEIEEEKETEFSFEEIPDESYFASGELHCDPPSDLEGQEEFMVLYPDCETLDWDSYPLEPEYITDLSVIEDDDVRAVAEYYTDNGFKIQNPVEDQIYGQGFGDMNRMFRYGFMAETEPDIDYEFIMVYKMNETLFNYYFVDWNEMNGPDVPVTDDGTVIRYGDDDFYVEFNRDTGIAILYDRDPSGAGAYIEQ